MRKLITTVLGAVNETQFGGIIGKGTDDALLIPNIITASALKRGVPLHKIYIDLVKAYDKISRLVLYKILERRGCPSKLLDLIKILHDETRAQIKYKSMLSEHFFYGQYI